MAEMKEAPYIPGKQFDDWLMPNIQACTEQMADNEDDALILFVGPPGTGKSNLMLHTVEAYNPDVDPDMVCLKIEKWASKQHQAVTDFYNGKKKNVLPLDEASLIGRDAMTAQLKDILKLMYQNRAAQIFHPWCWPSLRMFEKEFLNDRVKGIFYCYGKWRDKPRIYYFYPISAINRMVRDGYELTNFNLKHQARKYAMYKGRFLKYTGKLLDAYKEIKKEGVIDASAEFMKKYSGEGSIAETAKLYTTGEVAKLVGISDESVRRKRKLLEQLGLIQMMPGRLDKAYGYKPEAVYYLRNLGKSEALGGPVPILSRPLTYSNRASQDFETDEESKLI
jgi:hypothetical protein